VNKQEYRLLSRKYRPSNFEELIGQDSLVKTLSYAIIEGRLAQSYLLTGTRGIGKTTTARIIAKTINCTDLQIRNSTPIACTKCTNCTSFDCVNHPDIIEIDAASRTGVDDIRTIIESSEYKPLLGKYKVFIIDEVHMLSKNAFNALLKLLEEPPLHTIYIFATTEVHKIPLTIISRCQRFDLLRFSRKNIENLLIKISALEKIQYDDDGIRIIAIKADGSARDALSLLDQANLLAFTTENKTITAELVKKMVASVDHRIIIDFLKSIIISDAACATKLLEEFYSNNSDFSSFIFELLSLISTIAKKLAIVEYECVDFHNYAKEIEEITKSVDMTFSQIAWQICYKTQLELKESLNQLQNMEMLALKLIYLLSSRSDNTLPPPRQCLEKIPQLASVDDIIHVSTIEKDNYPQKSYIKFEEFLIFLNTNGEFDLYYDLFNKIEFVKIENTTIYLKARAHSPIFEQKLKSQAQIWANDNINILFTYSDRIISYKDTMKAQILNNDTIKRLVKNFPDTEIVDIVVSNQK